MIDYEINLWIHDEIGYTIISLTRMLSQFYIK